MRNPRAVRSFRTDKSTQVRNSCQNSPSPGPLRHVIEISSHLVCVFDTWQAHVEKHMAKLGLKKLCEALEQKYSGHAPRMELAGAFSIFDVNGDDMISAPDMSHIMKETHFGGPKLKGLKVRQLTTPSAPPHTTAQQV